jgi:hypothetical protein
MPLYTDLKTLDPQPILGSAGTAQQITTSTLTVRSVIIQAADTNADDVYIADSDTNAKSGKGMTLSPKDVYIIEGEVINGTFEMVRLSSLYWDGAATSDKLVVQYLE